MSQNDMSIANASGATVRADINSALQALASANGGASAPSTTYANQLWFDTTNDLLKIRDEANTNWVTIASLVGTTWTPYHAGTAQGTMSTLAYTAINQHLTMSGKQVRTALATVASATTPDLSAAAGNAIEITGTTTIAGYTMTAGTLYFVEYTGAGLQLTHNATSHILPGAANITAATGDSWFVFARTAANARVLGYQRANGTPVAGGSAATQAEMEAASSTTVFATPGRTQYHPGVAKWWISLDCTGTFSTRVSHNVTSTTDNGTGRAQVNIATDFSTADWNWDWGANTASVGNASTYGIQMRSTDASAMAAGTLEVQIGNTSAGTVADTDPISLKGHGDQ